MIGITLKNSDDPYFRKDPLSFINRKKKRKWNVLYNSCFKVSFFEPMCERSYS